MKLKPHNSPIMALITVISLFSAFASYSSVLAQGEISIHDPSGVGILSIAGGNNQSGLLNFSQDTLRVYDSPGGESLGIVYPGSKFFLAFSFDSALSDSKQMDPTDAIAITFGGNCLRLYDIADGYVEIMRNTLGETSQCWAKISDLREMGLEPMRWVGYFQSLNKSTTFYNRTSEGLSIRSAPHDDSSLVLNFTETGLRILLTGERFGDWLEVKVSDRYLEMDMDRTPINWTSGWVNPSGTAGQPGFWYYPQRSLSALSQESSSINVPSGVGILSIVDGANQSGMLNFSQDTLKVYDSPGGASLGIVYSGSTYFLAFSSNTAQDEPKQMDPTDALVVTVEGNCLRLYDTVDGYVEILRNTLEGKSQCWAKISDLKEMGLAPMLWVEFFLSLNREQTYFSRNSDGLAIRSAPSDDSSLVINLTDSGLRIILTGEQSGDWLEVRVTDMFLEKEEDSLTVNWKGGWVKSIDESGEPEFWFSLSGC